MPTKKTTKKTTGKRLIERSPTQMKFILIALAAVLVSFGAAYALGTNSSGQINVASTIEQNQQREAEENPDAPPQKLRDTRATVPNGGLVPAAVQPDRKKKPEPPKVEEVATTTDESATSTDEAADENAEVTSTEEAEAEVVAEEAEETEPTPEETETETVSES